MEHDNGISNPSKNRPFYDVLQARMSRRGALRNMTLSAAGFAMAFAGNQAMQRAVAATADPGAGVANGTAVARQGGGPVLNFNPVPVSEGSGPLPAISSNYEYQVLIPWGSPIDPANGVRAYEGVGRRPTAAEQAELIGIGHDGMWFFPIDNSNDHGVLCINHEFGTNPHVLGKAAPASLEDVRVSQHAHGVSVVELKKVGGVWQPVANSQYSRRIHVNTPVAFSGPAANSDLLKTPADPNLQNAKGTVNNCANGYTPWGTYLTCEENFNGYFGDTTGNWSATPEQARYGFSAAGFRYGWEQFDDRFNLGDAQHRNEENRFGWVVEIDPFNKSQTPVKRTALGRFKHEGVAVTVGQGGRVVCYMGDDERFDYIYKFVSARNWRSMQARGLSPLDEGKLYVAKFNDNGSGDWLELTINNPALKAAGFTSQAQVLTYARAAADVLGATPMDRPEWTTIAPDGKVYCTLTNNSRRNVVDGANPLAPNPHGHIISWQDGGRGTGLTFTWDIFVISENTHGTEASFASPDGLWADAHGRLFIQTDGDQVPETLNNQMLVADARTGEIRRILTGVAGDEITGLAITPDQQTLFCNTQHPGNGDPRVTNFPVENATPDGVTVPRDCTFVITRKGGGVVGS